MPTFAKWWPLTAGTPSGSVVAIFVTTLACAREIGWRSQVICLRAERDQLQQSCADHRAVLHGPQNIHGGRRLSKAALRKRRSSFAPSQTQCDANRSVAYVVASLVQHVDGTSFVPAMLEALPSLQVVRAVDGKNQTEVIEALLDSGLQFHNLSNTARKWGKLATFLTKWRALNHQLNHGHAFQITLEDDVVIRPSFRDFVQRTCQKYFEKNEPDIMFLSPYSEVLFTSLDGARTMVRKLREYGIMKNDDHQFSFRETMNHTVGFFRPFLFKKSEVKPWKQGRRTNMGDIGATSVMTWSETALLRLVTNPAARSLRYFGNMPEPPRTTKPRTARP